MAPVLLLVRNLTIGDTMAGNRRKYVRKDNEERRSDIMRVTAQLVSERGFNGISLKDVADAVGMSQPGLLHYVGNKAGLLSMLITGVYDVAGSPEEFLKSGLPGSDPQAPLFPAYLRYLVRCNAQRRMMVQLYIVLESESFNPTHPLHDYFMNRPQEVWEHYSRIPWKIPPQMRPWEETMRPVVRRAVEMMDGAQLRWLRQPPVDLYDEWLAFETMLFPSPMWDNYR